jgi:hypothetical protein
MNSNTRKGPKMKNEMILHGYASKNVGKWTLGHAWTQLGVLPISVFTFSGKGREGFRVRSIGGNSVDIYCGGKDLSYAVKGYVDIQMDAAKSDNAKAVRFCETASRYRIG